MKKSEIYVILSIAIFIFLWQIVSIITASDFFPQPMETVMDFFSMLKTPSLYNHIFTTFSRVFTAIFIAGTISLSLILLSLRSKFFAVFYKTVIYPISLSVSSISWSLMAVVWFGFSPISPIFVVTMILMPNFLVILGEGFDQMDLNLIEAAGTFTKNRFRIFKKIVIPLVYPFLFSSLTVAMSVAWKTILLAEVLASLSGIGFLFELSREVLNIKRIFSLTILMVIIVVFMNILLNKIDKTFFRRWKYVQHKSR